MRSGGQIRKMAAKLCEKMKCLVRLYNIVYNGLLREFIMNSSMNTSVWGTEGWHFYSKAKMLFFLGHHLERNVLLVNSLSTYMLSSLQVSNFQFA